MSSSLDIVGTLWPSGEGGVASTSDEVGVVILLGRGGTSDWGCMSDGGGVSLLSKGGGLSLLWGVSLLLERGGVSLISDRGGVSLLSDRGGM